MTEPVRQALAGFRRAAIHVKPHRAHTLDAATLRQWARLIGGTTAFCVMGIMLADGEQRANSLGSEVLALGLGVLFIGLYWFGLGIDADHRSTKWVVSADDGGLTVAREREIWRVAWEEIDRVECGDGVARLHLTSGEAVAVPLATAFARALAAAEAAAAAGHG